MNALHDYRIKNCSSYFFTHYIELKLSNNGGIKAAEKQIKVNKYTAPFKADKRNVLAIAIELDDLGKGLVDWKVVEESK